MKLQIKRFGKIHTTDVEWNGLTVIAGENDTGKSTVGKLFYAILKTFAKYDDTYSRVVGSELFITLLRLLSDILRGENRKILHRYKKLFVDTESLFVRLNELFTPAFVANNLFKIDDPLKDTIRSTVNALKNVEFVSDSIRTNLEKISDALEVNVSAEDKFKKSFQFYMKDSFLRNYNNSLNTKEIAEFEYFLEDVSNLFVKIKANNIHIERVDLNKKYPFFKDITLIDFPEILDERFQNLHESNFNWTDDLLGKTKLLKTKKDSQVGNFIGDDFWREVLSGSSIYLDKETNSFKYKVSSNALPLNIINIASGTKSFGILYLLIKFGIINEDTPIVLDEPENHLHPEWQIAYAKFLTFLVRKGFRILLTSHSPTFIQALLKEAIQEDKWEKMYKFYLAEPLKEAENFTTIRDVTSSPDDIFKNLVRPVEKMWSED